MLEGLNEAEAVLEGRDVAALWRTKPPALLLLPDNYSLLVIPYINLYVSLTVTLRDFAKQK